MTEQTRRECIKALAYGRTVSEICAVINVPKEEVLSITEKEISTQRDYLKSMGYIK
jgi:hypothetical protein